MLSGNVNTGKEWVTKICEMEMDAKKGIKNYYFNGELVGSEQMTQLDYQTEIE